MVGQLNDAHATRLEQALEAAIIARSASPLSTMAQLLRQPVYPADTNEAYCQEHQLKDRCSSRGGARDARWRW